MKTDFLTVALSEDCKSILDGHGNLVELKHEVGGVVMLWATHSIPSTLMLVQGKLIKLLHVLGQDVLWMIKFTSQLF